MESLCPGFRRMDRRFPVNIRVMGDSTMSCYRQLEVCMKIYRSCGADFLATTHFFPSVFTVDAVHSYMNVVVVCSSIPYLHFVMII